MKVIETVGKDIEEALKKGLAELDCRLDDVQVKILEHPGIFRKARVQFTYEGKDGRAAIKTKADIMRNLEQRAAKDAFDPNREGKNKRQDNDRRGKAVAPARGEQRTDVPRTEKRNDVATAPVKSNDGAAVSGNAKETKKDVEKPAVRTGERKNEFRNDFRSQLSEAQNEKPARQEAQPKQPRKEDQKNDRRQNEAFTAEELETAAKRADAYLDKLIALMNVKAEREYACVNGEVNVEIKTEDATVIGHRGETLDALEYLATLAASTGDDKFVHINLDCGGYRAKRNEMLVESALAAAEKAVATGKKVELEPMGSISRRTVHAVLSGRSDVTTKSEGREPNRYIVIIPRAAGGNGSGNRRNNGRKRHKNGNRGQNNRRNDRSE